MHTLLLPFLYTALLQTAPVEVLWTYAPPSGYVDASPALGDLTGDGRSEIVVGTVSGLVIALSDDGAELWRHEMRGPICVPPSIGALTDHPAPEVVVMNQQGQVVCLMGDTGRELWSASLPGRQYWGETTATLGDVTGDGMLEIVTGDSAGAVACFRGTGELLWLYAGGHGVTRAPIIADLTGDGRSEILVSGDRIPLVCLSADGQELWRREGGAGASPLAYDVTGDGMMEIVTAIGTEVTLLDGKGVTLWTHAMRREIDAALAVADADGDGEVEIYAVDLVGHLVCLSPRGQVRWTAGVEERARRSPTIADVDGCGVPEILVAGYSGALHVFDPEGRLKERVPLPGNSNSAATVVSLGAAGLGVVVPVASDAVRMLRWPGSREGARVLWPEHRFDSRRSGRPEAVSGETRISVEVDFGKMHVGANTMTVEIDNPAKQPMEVQLRAARNEGAPALATHISSDPVVRHRLSYVVPADRAVNLTLECEVSAPGQSPVRRSRTVYLVPFVKELNDAMAALSGVDALLPTLLDRGGLEERAHFLRARMDALSTRIPGAGALDNEARLFLRDDIRDALDAVDHLLALSTAAAQAAAQGSTLLVFAANPWAPFGGIEEIAEARLTAPTMNVEAFLRETESSALNLFNLGSRPRAILVSMDPLTGNETALPAQEVITLHETLEVPTEMRDTIGDALPHLNTANIIHLPPWSARQLWFNIDTGKLTPGAWTTEIRLASLDVEPLEATAALELTVWNAAVPAEQPVRLCHWGYVHQSLLKDHPDEALADQVRNGTNVFVGLFFPQATYDEEGNIVGEIDFEAHDAYVKRHAPHGMILFFNYQRALKGPGDMNSEAYATAHVQWLRAWVAHLATLGVGYDGFALYPVDEPGLSDGLVEHNILMGRLAREADPNILLYTDPVGRISEDEIRALLPYVDIWCPNRDGLLLDKTNAAKLDIIKNSGATLWMYECAGNAKHQSPLGYYRAQAWLAWEHDMTGIGFWSYCTSRDNPWFTPGHRHDYLLVYPGNGVVSSRRWEAVRDGIEDYGMLHTLRHALANPSSSATPEDLDAAKRLLDDGARRVALFCGLDEDGTLLSGDDPPRARRVADQRLDTINALRREIARLLDVLVP